MKYLIYSMLLLVIFSACTQNQKIQYPVSEKVDVVDTYFGNEVKDPYRWLEDDNSSKTAEWVRSQNNVTFDYLNQIPFREELKERLSSVWNYEKVGAPF